MRKVYLDGSLVKQGSKITTDTYTLAYVQLKSMDIAAADTDNNTAFNLGRTIYGARLYDRELSAAEIALNAAVDERRYKKGKTSIGTADGQQLLEKFDTDGNAYTEISVTFDNEGKATIPLVLNYAGKNDLTFTVNNQSANLTLNVLTQSDKASVTAVNAAIDEIPTDITESNLNEALSKVAAAQKAYDELAADLKEVISIDRKHKLDNAASKIDAAAAGQHEVTVTYNANGGTVSPESQTVIYKETNEDNSHKTFTLAVPTRRNYTFTGWALNGTLITNENGVSSDWWDSLSDVTVVAQWTSNAEKGTVLEITEAEDIYALARIFGGTGTNEDYQRFGYNAASTDAKNKLMDANTVYELKNDITLTNHDGDTSNGFYGIPNFAGTFNGNDNTITLDINFSAYTNTGDCGGVFQSLNGATVKNIKLAGTASGNISLRASLNNIGLLIGVANGSKATTIENIHTSVAVNNATLTNNNHTAYIGELIGRSAMGSAAKLAVVTKCINDGNISVAVVGELSNPSRVAGLIGHANAGIVMDSCRNNGTVTVTGDSAYAGGLAGTSGGTYVNCVEAGSLSAEKGSAEIFAGMPNTATKDDSNKIIVKIIGTDGEKITAQDGVSATVTDGVATLELPVYYVSDTSRRYDKYDVAEAIIVNGEKSLYLYDMRTRTATLTLNTADAAAEAVPFSSWNAAIHFASAEDMINLQNAINNGDANAIAAVYKLGGIAAAPTDLATAQMVLRSAYYVLDKDVTLDQGFTGIGTATNGFGGHFDGGNHKVTLSITVTPSETEDTGYYGLFGKMGPLTDGAVEVKNLQVESTINITLPNSLAYGVYAGSLAGYVSHLTVDNVSVTTNGISAQASEAMTNQNDHVVSLGGAFGFERILIGGTVDTTVSGPITAKIPGTRNNAQLGGFAGQGETGGSVTFTDGASVLAGTGAESAVGGIMGYSWAQNDFTGLTVKNLSETPLQLGDANTRTGLLIGNHTTNGIQSDEIGIKIDGFQPEGKFTMTGKRLGGLIGLAETNGIIEITNSAANVGDWTSATYFGGLIGQCGTSDKTTYKISNTIYVKATDGLQAVGYPGNDIEGVVALDVTKVIDGTFSTPIEDVLSAAAPAALTVEGNAKFDGTSLIYTAAGDNQEIKFLWNGQELCSATVNVAQKNLTNDANVTITGVNSTYPSDEAAAKAEIDVIYNGVNLVEGTDYTVDPDKDAHKFTIDFKGNYTGSAEKTYAVASNALVVTAADYNGTYDGKEHSITVDAPADTTVTYGESANACTQNSITKKNAGTYVIYWQAAKDEQTVTGSAVISIAKAPLTIKADDKSMTVGGTLPDFTYTSTGLVNDENLKKNPDLVCSADGSVAGTYDIVPSGADAGTNYEITYANGTLTVSRRSSGGSSSGSSTTTNTVSASTASNGNVTLDKSTAKKGDTVTITVTPDAGYELDKLTVTDAKGNTLTVTDKGNGKYTFTMPDGKVTITPAFTKIADEKPSANGYVDVASSAWYNDAVQYVTDKGLMSGTGDNKFSPNASTTRGMLMTVLARYAGQDTSGSTPWYQKGMDWAKANGVSDGTKPTVNITREQLVTMLYRYAGSPAANGSLDNFSDASTVSTYAVNAMQWAVSNDIVSGSNSKLNPKNNATRAEVAAILMRFCELNDK